MRLNPLIIGLISLVVVIGSVVAYDFFVYRDKEFSLPLSKDKSKKEEEYSSDEVFTLTEENKKEVLSRDDFLNMSDEELNDYLTELDEESDKEYGFGDYTTDEPNEENTLSRTDLEKFVVMWGVLFKGGDDLKVTIDSFMNNDLVDLSSSWADDIQEPLIFLEGLFDGDMNNVTDRCVLDEVLENEDTLVMNCENTVSKYVKSIMFELSDDGRLIKDFSYEDELR